MLSAAHSHSPIPLVTPHTAPTSSATQSASYSCSALPLPEPLWPRFVNNSASLRRRPCPFHLPAEAPPKVQVQSHLLHTLCRRLQHMPLLLSAATATAAAHSLLPLLLLLVPSTSALILSGSPQSFARYPKWAQTFENELSLEFKTRQSNALLVYTDDGGVQMNFFAVSVLEGHVQVELRLGEGATEPPEQRPLIQIGMPETRVDDGRWHKFTFFQAWENVKVQVDEEAAFRVLSSQRTFSLGNIRTNSDLFVGGIPKEVERLSSPLRRHSLRLAGSVRNLVYRLYPQGVSSPLLTDSLGTRKTDEDYCSASAAAPGTAKVQHQWTVAGTAKAAEYCQNGGRCYSANNGPRCDCSLSEFEGRRCEIKRAASEVSFFGGEWLGYDLRSAQNGSAAEDAMAVWSLREWHNLTFRTNHSNGLLLLAGDSRSHLKLFLERGQLLAHSQMGGSDRRIIRVQDRALRRVHLDDNLWHSVVLVRQLHSMRLLVDDFFDQEVKQFSADRWLGNAFLFLGGVPPALAHLLGPERDLFPFRGCLKQAFFQSGPILLNLIQLADQGFGQSHVQTFGDLSYSCSPNAQVPEVFSFNSGANFTLLPAWNSPARGTIAFQFRTLLPEGLLLYHGQANCANFTSCDFLAFELIDAHLMMAINLGSGHIRLQVAKGLQMAFLYSWVQASAKALNDGHWHSVVMERSGRRGFVTVDALRTDFSCPGISANLDIGEPIFLGAVPWPNPFARRALQPSQAPPSEAVTVIQLVEESKQPSTFPSMVWTIGLRAGFIGCLKNVRVNGLNAQIAHAFHAKLKQQVPRNSVSKEPISVGCPFSFSADFCGARNAENGDSETRRPPVRGACRNGGICVSAHNAFRCDCSGTQYEGPNCSHKPRLVSFPLSPRLPAPRFALPEWHSEAENVELKFRLRLSANEDQGQKGLFVLLDSRANGGRKDRMLLALAPGGGALLANWVFAGGEEQTLHWPTARNISADDRWHFARVRRRGRSVGLLLDGHWSLHALDTPNAAVTVNELAVGQPIGPHKLKGRAEHLFSFHGDLRHFSMNGRDLLRAVRSAAKKESGALDEEMDALEEAPAVDGLFAFGGGASKYELFPGVYSTLSAAPFPDLNSSSAFFTKAPLGCLRQSAEQRHTCEPEPTPPDGFFTPVLPKQLRKSTSSTSTTSTSTTSTTSASTAAPTTRSTFAPTTEQRRRSSSKPRHRQQHSTSAPTHTRRPTATQQTTPTPRFPVSPNDPTLIAVRPTTPMNGARTATQAPQLTQATTSFMDSSTNQLGDDKKFMIGVGSLGIVLMLAAILLCVFCKRCNTLCSQLAAAAGAGAAPSPAGGAGMKAGYTPIPPADFQSPQLQHQMAQFDRAQGTITTSVPRNGAGSLGNGLATSTGGGLNGNGVLDEQQRRQTRVVLANGGGGTTQLRETTSLIGAATDQRKRDFKEWYV